MDRVVKSSKKVLIGVVGGIIILVGLVMVPYPGPGWLIVFAGLAVLASEFRFARRLQRFGRQKYDAWVDWLMLQRWPIRIIAILFTTIIVIATLWALNTFGMLGGLIGLDHWWLSPPYFR